MDIFENKEEEENIMDIIIGRNVTTNCDSIPLSPLGSNFTFPSNTSPLPSVLSYNDEPIDIMGSNKKCCHCKKEFYIPMFFYPHLEKYELKIDNGAFEHHFGYVCLECQDIPCILDIVAAKNSLCLLSDWTIKTCNARMECEYDRISRVAEWNPVYGEWCLNWYTVPNSSTKPLLGDSFLHLFKSYDVQPSSFLKRQPRDVLEALHESGVPYDHMPLRKMKVCFR